MAKRGRNAEDQALCWPFPGKTTLRSYTAGLYSATSQSHQKLTENIAAKFCVLLPFPHFRGKDKADQFGLSMIYVKCRFSSVKNLIRSSSKAQKAVKVIIIIYFGSRNSNNPMKKSDIAISK